MGTGDPAGSTGSSGGSTGSSGVHWIQRGPLDPAGGPNPKTVNPQAMHGLIMRLSTGAPAAPLPHLPAAQRGPALDQRGLREQAARLSGCSHQNHNHLTGEAGQRSLLQSAFVGGGSGLPQGACIGSATQGVRPPCTAHLLMAHAALLIQLAEPPGHQEHGLQGGTETNIAS